MIGGADAAAKNMCSSEVLDLIPEIAVGAIPAHGEAQMRNTHIPNTCTWGIPDNFSAHHNDNDDDDQTVT